MAKSWNILICAVLLWLLAVAGGFGMLLHYNSAGGAEGVTPQTWPVGTRIDKDPAADTLIMFVHPKCPCTRASMEELNRVLARSQGRAATQVWFAKPKNTAEDWVHTDLWKSAVSIPGVTVHEDLEAAEAARFGAETSGYVVLYSKEGRLLFHGGITGGRGHAGDNAGQNAVVALLANRGAVLSQTPVYGCSLLSKPENSPYRIDQ